MPNEESEITKKARRKREQDKAYAEYKILNKELNHLDEGTPTDEANEVISRHLERAATLYPKIHKKFDYAAIDAEHFKRLAALGADSTSRLQIGTDLFNIKLFGKKLRKAIANVRNSDDDSEARCSLGKLVGDCILTAPTFDFIYGTFSPAGLEVKVRAIRKVEKKVKTEPEVILKAKEKDTATEINNDTTPKEVDQIYKKLRLTSKRKNAEYLNILDNLNDPHSFGQTVENLFHFSFLVKEGKVAIKKADTGAPICKLVRPSSSQSTIDTKFKNQSILSFSMADYKKWLEKINERPDEEVL